MKLSRRRSRGVAPLIIGIAALIFGLLAVLISTFAPQIAQWLLGAFGGEQGVYFFLIEIPTADVNNPAVMTTPITNVFNLLRNIALVFFAVVLIIAGLYYALESFRLVSEGTAASIVTGSVFTALMIYLFLPVYNVVASLFNTLTSPNQGYILAPGMIRCLIEWAIRAPSSGNLAGEAVAFFMSVFFLVMVAITLIAVAILGILRIFFIGAVVAIMPIALVLRLIPLTRRIAESFIDMLIGLMLSSLMSAIFLRFGYEVINAGSFTGLAGTVVAWGTLIAAAMMPTVLAPRLGSLFMSTVGMVSAAVSTAAIGTVGTLSGIAVGTMKGGVAAAQAVKTGTMGGGRAVFTTLRSGVTAAAPFMTGALTGRFAGAIPMVGGVPSLGGAVAAASESRRQLGSYVDRFLRERAGTATEAFMSALPFVKASPLASEADGLAWKKKIETMSDEEAGEFFRKSFPEVKLLKKYNSHVGREFKSMMAKASPILASSIIAHLQNMREDKLLREAFMKQAIENHASNREKLRAMGYPVPDIPEEADATPTFMRDIFRYGGETARIVNAKIFHGALSHYNPQMPLEEARKAARNFVEKVTIDEKTRRKLSDEEIAEKLAELVNVRNLSSEEKKAFGYAARRYLTTLQRDAPRILAAAWKAVNEPKWSDKVKSSDFTEAAVKSVEGGVLQNRLANMALRDLREILSRRAQRTVTEMREREAQVRDSLRAMFTPTPDLGTFFRRVEREAAREARLKPPSDLAFRDFWRMIEKENLPRKSGYTPPKPRKRGKKIAEGFGGEFTASLEKYMKKKKHEGEQ